MSVKTVYDYGEETSEFRDEEDIVASEYDDLTRSPITDPREQEPAVGAEEVTRRITIRTPLWRKLFDMSKLDWLCPLDTRAALEDAEPTSKDTVRVTLDAVDLDWIRSHENDLRRAGSAYWQSWIDRLVSPWGG